MTTKHLPGYRHGVEQPEGARARCRQRPHGGAGARTRLPHDRRPGGGCEVAERRSTRRWSRVLGAIMSQLGPLAAAVRAIGLHRPWRRPLCARRGRPDWSAAALSPPPTSAPPRVLLKLARSHGARAVRRRGLRALARTADADRGRAVRPRRGAARRTAAPAVRQGLPGLPADRRDRHRPQRREHRRGWSRWPAAAGRSATFDAAGLSDLCAAHARAHRAQRRGVRPAAAPRRPRPAACPPGVPVAMGAIDLLASMTAIRAEARGRTVAVFGTWSVNAAIGRGHARGQRPSRRWPRW